MNSKMTGWLFLIAPLITLVFWLVSGMPTDASDLGVGEIVGELGKNPDWLKLSVSLASLGVVGTAIGWASMKGMMSGSNWAYIGGLAILISVPGQIAEAGLVAGTGSAGGSAAAAAGAGMADAAVAAGAVGAALWSASQAVGALSSAVFFLGIASMGIGMILQKNVHIISASSFAIMGILGVAGAAYDYGSLLMAVPYIGMVLTSVAVGVELIRSK